MATVLIRDGIFSGCLAGLMAQRRELSFTPSDYATVVNAADAIASECITQNAALGTPMADADNAQIGGLCFGAALATTFNTLTTSATATDYVKISQQIVALAKQGEAKLV